VASLAIALSGARRYSLVLRQPRAVGYPTDMSRLVILARLSATMLNTTVRRADKRRVHDVQEKRSCIIGCTVTRCADLYWMSTPSELDGGARGITARCDGLQEK
jgi:hypothetical protein